MTQAAADDDMPKHRPTSLGMLRYRVRHLLGQWPVFNLPFARWWYGEGDFSRAVRANSKIVIEGYPRSANSFAEAAFRQAQKEHVEMGHHLHLAAQVLYAIKHDIPSLVLIREPQAAAISYMLLSSYPSESAQPALREYVRFYETLLPYRNKFVLAEFTEVVSDFGKVIDRINQKYATTFQRFEHTEANTRACFEACDVSNRRQNNGRISWSDVARPDAQRDQAKQKVRQRILDERHAKLLERARSLYLEYTR